MSGTDPAFGPWSPGLSSTIPARLMPLASLFAPENGLVAWDEAAELARRTGLRAEELATFRPRRLAQHRCLVRVTAELHVPDGPRYADLGLNLRSMAATIFDSDVMAEMGGVEAAFTKLREDAGRIVDSALHSLHAPREVEVEAPKGFFARFKRQKSAQQLIRSDDSVMAALAELDTEAGVQTGLQAACLGAVVRVCNGVLAQRGAVRVADRDWIRTVVINLISNAQGDALVATLIDPLFDAAVTRLGYARLPPQSHPVVLNAKGASAAGKSSIRTDQRQIAARLGLDWADFAIISPDYWRKYLIDYDGLGDDFKYAAMLCGQELEIIDKKLDVLMADLGARGAIPHLLIDRFRFDSFQLAESRTPASRLLTRFGAKIYMFFLITPPQDTVRRAWSRGLETGRYKAVDDLLYHNIEAYSGMPDLFFSWVAVRDRWIHYEFLDNSVPIDQPPRTIACGRNGRLVIIDVEKFCDIERFRHVNVDAQSADDILDLTLDLHKAMAIVRRACAELAEVDILVPGTDRVFTRARNGQIEVDLKACPDDIPASVFGEVKTDLSEFDPVEPEMWTEIIGDLNLNRP